MTRALLRAGSPHEFTLVLDSGAAAASDLPDTPRVEVPTLTAVVSAATAGGSRSIRDMWRMSRALTGFDAVIFPTNYSFVPVARGPFVVVVIHDALPEKMPQMVLGSRRARLLWNLKNRIACMRANQLATVSEASARELRAHLPVNGGRIAVLTEGVGRVFTATPSPDDEARVVGAVRQHNPFVLFVGGFSPHKRVPDLVRAFGAVASQPGHENLLLVLTGPTGTDRFESDDAALREAIRGLGEAGRRVVFTGFVPDETLAALYRTAECVVLPSIAEGFGLPALESMACGAPLIVARNDALTELCGSAAEYFDDIAGLPSTLARVVNDGSRRDALSRAGLDRARLFGWDEGARRLLSALEPAAKRARG
jgi:glycosyltransferase involved in cell wall biosynthesis